MTQWRSMGIKEAIIKAFKQVPREIFVPDEYKSDAYLDYPLPIGAEQTISQPSTVVFMLNALNLEKGNKVLEIGTGSGWNACLIAKIIEPGIVYTTEIVPDLVMLAKNNIKKCKINNVKIIKTDGSKGYKKEAPFDRIIITAACPQIPKPLIDQLNDSGIIIAPVGPAYVQKMMKGVKNNGKLVVEYLGDFRFVPLIGKHGY